MSPEKSHNIPDVPEDILEALATLNSRQTTNEQKIQAADKVYRWQMLNFGNYQKVEQILGGNDKGKYQSSFPKPGVAIPGRKGRTDEVLSTDSDSTGLIYQGKTPRTIKRNKSKK